MTDSSPSCLDSHVTRQYILSDQENWWLDEGVSTAILLFPIPDSSGRSS